MFIFHFLATNRRPRRHPAHWQHRLVEEMLPSASTEPGRWPMNPPLMLGVCQTSKSENLKAQGHFVDLAFGQLDV
jgi:hypothetical protein